MYSAIVMDHFHNPRNAGKLSVSNARGTAGDPSAGAYMVVYLRIEAGVVAEASFETFGCAAAIASGSVLTEHIKGGTLDHARQLSAEVLLDRLGGLPLGREHCPPIAVSALQLALQEYENTSSPGAGPGVHS